MYVIRFDSAAGILYLQLKGFWTVPTTIAFIGEMVVATGAARLRYGADYAVLSDSRAFAIQSEPVNRAMDVALKQSGHLHRGYSAIVVANSLSKLQAERVIKHDRSRVFLDMNAALAWLKQVHPQGFPE